MSSLRLSQSSGRAWRYHGPITPPSHRVIVWWKCTRLIPRMSVSWSEERLQEQAFAGWLARQNLRLYWRSQNTIAQPPKGIHIGCCDVVALVPHVCMDFPRSSICVGTKITHTAEILMGYRWDTNEISLRYKWDTAEIMMRYRWDTDEMPLKYSWDTAERLIR